MSDLPKSWSKVKITELLKLHENGKPFQQGWSPQCEARPAGEGEWGVLKTTAIQEGEFLDFENKRLPDHLEPRPTLEVSPGEILMTCAGPRSRCGVTCLVRKTRPKLLMSGKMYRFSPNSLVINSVYLEKFLLSKEAKDSIDRMKTGISDSGLNLTHGRLAELDVPLGPRHEQDRIVAKVEELFSELDKGVESLKTAREQLKVYRQAVLKYAFEGKLTERWREENNGELENGDQLLTRILREREARYQQRIKEWKAAVEVWDAEGKEGKKPAKPKSLPPIIPHADDVKSNLSGLPDGWIWSKIGAVFGVYVGATPSRKEPLYWGGKIDWVSSGEVGFCRIKNTREHVTDEGLNNTSTEIHPPGTVMLGMIGEGKTRGQSAILDIPACHNQNTAAIRVSETDCSPEFLYHYFFYQCIC